MRALLQGLFRRREAPERSETKEPQAMTEYFDRLETRSPEERAAAQLARLREVLGLALRDAPAARELLPDLDPAAIDGPEALARLPVLRKSELGPLQAKRPPLGGLTTKPAEAFDHLFMSPGPIFEPGSDAQDWWRFARAFFAAGFRKGDILHNCFGYHLTPAGAMMENGAKALGCAVFPGGVGATDQQITAMSWIGPTGYVGTPDYLKTLLEAADAARLDLSSLKRALVSGGALFPSLRQAYAERGIACLQCYATADLGLVAYETASDGAPNPGMVVDEGVILEIVRPGTSDPLPEGEVGEVVVTSLNADYPLIRFGTGDLSAVLPGPSPCGRTGLRIKGWMGRADQRTKIKGMFVDPGQVAQVVAAHPEIRKARVVVRREGDQDAFELVCETVFHDDSLAARVAETMASAFKLKGAVRFIEPGSLPNDGLVIEDARDYAT